MSEPEVAEEAVGREEGSVGCRDGLQRLDGVTGRVQVVWGVSWGECPIWRWWSVAERNDADVADAVDDAVGQDAGWSESEVDAGCSWPGY
jgi:hypothetical protein